MQYVAHFTSANGKVDLGAAWGHIDNVLDAVRDVVDTYPGATADLSPVTDEQIANDLAPKYA